MLFLKTFKEAKFTVDGSVFQTFITLQCINEKLLSNASCTSRLKQFILMALSVSGSG